MARSLLLSFFLSFISLSSLVHSAHADAIVPFFVRRDEGGELVVMVVYGPHEQERVAVYCRKSERALYAQGPGVIQCVETNPSKEEYELRLPFQFVRNEENDITGVSYDEDPQGITISFRLRETIEGVTVAEPFDKEENASSQKQLRIPYDIKYDEDGSVSAVVFEEETQYVIPMEFLLSDDGSRVVGVLFSPTSLEKEESNEGRFGLVMDLGIAGIVLGLAILASVGFYLQKRQDRKYADVSCDGSCDVSKSKVSEQGTADDLDEMETIPVL